MTNDCLQCEETGSGSTHVHVDLLHRAAAAGAPPAESPVAGLHGGGLAFLY